MKVKNKPVLNEKTGKLKKKITKKDRLKRSKKSKANIPLKTVDTTFRKPKKNKKNVDVANDHHVVPWYSADEWNRVCQYFLDEKYEALISEIRIWRERGSPLPVGVETTFLLVQSIQYDQTLLNTDATNFFDANSFSEDHARSFYSLAIIRFLNHISHLATKELGGTSVLPMFKLASHVDVPEWIVNLRHEAAHGISLPSIQVLRLAADFIKLWLKDNYWKIALDYSVDVGEEEEKNYPRNLFSSDLNEVVANDELLTADASQLVSSYVACRLFKFRGISVISDKNILTLLPGLVPPVKAKTAALALKSKITSILDTNPAILVSTLAKEMIPTNEFFSSFSALCGKNKRGGIKTTIDSADPFDHYASLWSPLIKMLSRKSKLTDVCYLFVKCITTEEESTDEFIFSMYSKWVQFLLNHIINSGKIDGSKIIEILRTVLKAKNNMEYSFLPSILELAELRLGCEKAAQLETLLNITRSSSEQKSLLVKRLHDVDVSKFFTVETIQSAYDDAYESDGLMEYEDNGANSEIQKSKYNCNRKGGENYWRTIPLGKIFGVNS